MGRPNVGRIHHILNRYKDKTESSSLISDKTREKTVLSSPGRRVDFVGCFSKGIFHRFPCLPEDRISAPGMTMVADDLGSALFLNKHGPFIHRGCFNDEDETIQAEAHGTRNWRKRKTNQNNVVCDPDGTVPMPLTCTDSWRKWESVTERSRDIPEIHTPVLLWFVIGPLIHRFHTHKDPRCRDCEC
jgi:hypothetical protein